MSDNPLLRTPGELINEAREAQDLTIAQLSERTKIPPPVLNALELDEYHKISGPLYIKSFLRTCAVDLGLDPETVLSLYSRISGEKKSGPRGKEMIWEEDKVQISHVGLPWVKIILVAGILVALVGVVLFVMRGCGNEEETPVAAMTSTEDSTTTVEKVATNVPADSTEVEVSRRETMMDSSTEEDLRQRSAARREKDLGGSESSQAQPSPDDTVAPAWQESLPPLVARPDTLLKSAPEKEIPVQTDTVALVPIETVAEPAVVIEAAAKELEVKTPEPEPFYVDQIDSAWPLVLRIVCDSPREILVKRDGEGTFQQAQWPADQVTGPAVPEAGFEAGRAYRQNGQLLVFWGAEDHFSLKLARVRGVEVSINGRVRDISRLRPGQEIILDAHAADSSERR